MKIDELIEILKEVAGKKEKKVNIVAIIIIAILVIVAIAAAVFAVYKFVSPADIDCDDYEIEDEDDYEEFFEDEEVEIAVQPREEKAAEETTEENE